MPPEIKKIELRHLRIPFRVSFRHNQAIRNETDNILVKVTSADGIEGYGECIPRPYLSGETAQSVVRDFKEFWWPKVQGKTLNGNVTDATTPLFTEASSLNKLASYSGLDIALYDLIAKHSKKSVQSLLSYTQGPINKILPIGDSPIAVKIAIALAGRILGYKAFKVKWSVSRAILALKILRYVLGKQKEFVLDFNGVDTDVSILNYFRELEAGVIDAIEEPTMREYLASWQTFEDRFHIGLIADDSMCTQADAQKHIEAHTSKYWNLRLAKNGGFTGVNFFLKMAKSHGIKSRLGVLVGQTPVLEESSNLLGQSSEFVTSEAGWNRWLLKYAPFSRSKDESGLGLKPNQDVIEKFTVDKTTLE